MLKIFLLAFALGASIASYATQASAVTCAKGANNAACVGPRGAAMGHRGAFATGGGAVVRGSTTVHPQTGAVIHRGTTIRRY